MTIDVDELRNDVTEALANGRPNVTLIYANDDDYYAALKAMQDDHDEPMATKHHKGGIIVIVAKGGDMRKGAARLLVETERAALKRAKGD